MSEADESETGMTHHYSAQYAAKSEVATSANFAAASDLKNQDTIAIPKEQEPSTKIWDDLNTGMEGTGNWNYTLLIASMILIVVCLMAAVHNLGCLKRNKGAKIAYSSVSDDVESDLEMASDVQDLVHNDEDKDEDK